MKEEKNNWIKIGAIFAIVIMLGSVFFIAFDSIFGDWGNETTGYPFADVPGAHVNFTFNNAKDAAALVPEGVLSLNIVRVFPNDTIDQGIKQAFPGAQAQRRMVASYPAGYLEYYPIENESNASILINGTAPTYETYQNYNVIFINPIQRVIVGNPIILASFFNATADSTLAQKAIDVLTGTTSGSTTLNDILQYADNVSNYDQIIVYQANPGSDYGKYYQRVSQGVNTSTGQLIFQVESIVLQPNDAMKADIYTLAENANESVEYTVLEEGNVLKLYLDGSNLTSFRAESDALYQLVSNHTQQASNSTA